MAVTVRRIAKEHGTAEVGLSRYLVLYLVQAGWLGLGVYLMYRGTWPSTCQPTDVWRAISCSIHLPDNRGVIESALMTWLWTTPLLAGLELMRRFNGKKR